MSNPISNAVNTAQKAAKDVAEAAGVEEEADALEDKIQKATGIDLGGSGGGKNNKDVKKQGKEDPGNIDKSKSGGENKQKSDKNRSNTDVSKISSSSETAAETNKAQTKKSGGEEDGKNISLEKARKNVKQQVGRPGKFQEQTSSNNTPGRPVKRDREAFKQKLRETSSTNTNTQNKSEIEKIDDKGRPVYTKTATSVTVQDEETTALTESGREISRAELKQKKAEAREALLNLEAKAEFLKKEGKSKAASKAREKASEARDIRQDLETGIEELNDRPKKGGKENGRKRALTKEGRSFLQEREELQDAPTFSLTEKSVTGELVKEGILGQAAEAGETFAETAAKRTTPKIFNQAIEENVDDLASLGVESGEGKPREAFKQSLPSLSVAQDRAKTSLDELVQENTDQKQRKQATDLAVNTAGIIQSAGPASPFNDLTGEIITGPARPISEKIAGKTPGYIAKEVPEKIVEGSSVAGATAAAVRNPERLAKETALGAATVTKNAAENPIEFGVGELAVDAGLDLSTGGGAVITVPKVQKAGGKVKSGVSTVREFRQNAKNSPNFLDAAVQQGLGNMPESQVLKVDTAGPVPEQGPANTPGPKSQPGTLNVMKPEPEPLQTIKPETETAATTQTSAGVEAIGFTGSFSTSESISESSPSTQSLADTEAIPGFEAVTEPVSKPAAVSQIISVPKQVTEPVSKTAAEPVPQTVPKPLAETVPKPVSRVDIDEDIDSSLTGFKEKTNADQETVRTPSFDAVFKGITVKEDELEMDGEEKRFTGLETRPVILEDKNEEVNDLSSDFL